MSFFSDCLNSLDPCTFIVTVNGNGLVSVFRGQELIHYNVQLPMEEVYFSALFVTYLDGEPCLAIAGYGKEAGVCLRHAVTLDEVRSPPYKGLVYCMCMNAAGTNVFFGTHSGWIFVRA